MSVIYVKLRQHDALGLTGARRGAWELTCAEWVPRIRPTIWACLNGVQVYVGKGKNGEWRLSASARRQQRRVSFFICLTSTAADGFS